MDSCKGNLFGGIFKEAGRIQLSVSGDSMYPVLCDGDLIIVACQDEYSVGDVLVYKYKDQHLVVHRLLKANKRLYCKGDNSFLLEHVNKGDVLGKVVGIRRGPRIIELMPFDSELIELSYKISKLFRECGYKKETICENPTYEEYISKLSKLAQMNRGKKIQ